MPVSSLPSPYGIGSLGKAAYNFVDFLESAGQHYWQILPIGPTGYGDSPYQSFSAFAANPYFIDLETLVRDGLLTRAEIQSVDFGESLRSIDYYALYKNRYPLLRKAALRFDTQDAKFLEFVKENADWLPDYALFMALKGEYDNQSFTVWPQALRARDPQLLTEARKRLAKEITFWQVTEYLFACQWRDLKTYANKRGVELIGDIPIYVSPDSSDLWAHPELFQADAQGNLSEVAGCPPDGFSADGQLWGNPLYAWQQHVATDFAWWIRRMQYAATIYDVVRIDHFRGIAGYYAIPAGETTAINGRWRTGPGMKLIGALQKALPGLRIIAEDLGFLTPDVLQLLEDSGYPGMKVLQFAFDSREESDYLPHNYPRNAVVYTGTHDNTTTADWEFSANPDDVATARAYLDIGENDRLVHQFIRAAFGSVADTAIIPMQDWLCLGAQARINTPSTLGGNWLWRIDPAALTPALAKKIHRQTKLYGRIVAKKNPEPELEPEPQTAAAE